MYPHLAANVYLYALVYTVACYVCFDNLWLVTCRVYTVGHCLVDKDSLEHL